MVKMNCYIKYSKYLIKHKWYVMLACFKHSLIWRGIKHDISKLNLKKEFIPYAKHFFGDNKPKRDKTGFYKPTPNEGEVNTDFHFAWLHHANHNSHHWQYWTQPLENGTYMCYDIPEKDILEMVCDWESAGKAQKSKSNPKQWYDINKDKLVLHEKSRKYIENKLKEWY